MSSHGHCLSRLRSKAARLFHDRIEVNQGMTTAVVNTLGFAAIVMMVGGSPQVALAGLIIRRSSDVYNLGTSIYNTMTLDKPRQIPATPAPQPSRASRAWSAVRSSASSLGSSISSVFRRSQANPPAPAPTPVAALDSPQGTTVCASLLSTTLVYPTIVALTILLPGSESKISLEMVSWLVGWGTTSESRALNNEVRGIPRAPFEEKEPAPIEQKIANRV